MTPPPSRDEIFPGRPPRTLRVVRWIGLAVGFLALILGGRIAISHLASRESPGGHVAREIEQRLQGTEDEARATLEEADRPTDDAEPAGRPSPREGSPVAARPPSAQRVRIAVVFDDLGYAVDGLARELYEMPGPLTFAVLPGLAYSDAFADSARARGHEVLLHLPMEPLDPFHHNPGKGALLVDLEPEENLRRLHVSLGGLARYSGISNHMGSRFTADAILLKPVLREVKRIRPGTFLLDSRTNTSSVLADEARRLGIPVAANDLFLDGKPARPVRQARRIKELARQRGHAVTIGHVHRSTVDAVRDAIAEWTREGIELVRVSELVHSPSELP